MYTHEKSDDDKKDSKNDEELELDDGQQEVQVNNSDLRHKAAASPIKNENIIACIGTIQSTYIGSDGKTKDTIGTGTVYKVSDSYAYVITCAHNLRFTEYFQCHKCKVKNSTRECSICLTTNSTANILKAGKIYFQQKNLKSGDIEQTYKCDIVYIEDKKYAQFPLPKSGYDIAIIKFKDMNNYYKNVAKNILLVNGNLFRQVRCQNDPYYIYGYPQIVIKNAITDKNKRRHEMWGAESIHDKFEYAKNHYNNGQSFLKQKEIDASSGTSGAAIFSIYNQFALIFAIHTGGSSKYKYNVGNFLDEKIDYLQIKTAQQAQIKTVDDLIKETLNKIELQIYHFFVQNKFVYKRANPEHYNFNSTNNNQIFNIGVVWSYFRPGMVERHLTNYRSTGFIIHYSSQFAYLLATVAAVRNGHQTTADKILFELSQNTSDGLGTGDRIAIFAAVSWKICPQSDNIVVIKISDPERKLQKIKPVRLRSSNTGFAYNKGVVIGYNSPYGLQLFGMKGDIECVNVKSEIKYTNIVWRGVGGPIFGCDEIKNNGIVEDVTIGKQEDLSLIQRLLGRGLHIDCILNGLAQVNSRNDYHVYNYICADAKYKPSKKDQDLYNKTDSNYNYIFSQFDNEIIGVNNGKNGILLTDQLLKWIQQTCNNL